MLEFGEIKNKMDTKWLKLMVRITWKGGINLQLGGFVAIYVGNQKKWTNLIISGTK